MPVVTGHETFDIVVALAEGEYSGNRHAYLTLKNFKKTLNAIRNKTYIKSTIVFND